MRSHSFRRISDRPPSGMFRGGELPKLLAMVMMLMLLVMAIFKARDPNMWVWLTGENPRRQEDAAPLVVATTETPETKAAPSGPTDLDPAEAEAAKKEFSAVTDKAYLNLPDSFAYRRLLTWQRSQTFDQMRARAASDVAFRQFLSDPDRYRGKLIYLKLHLIQAIDHRVSAEDFGVDKIYEVIGWDSNSQPYTFTMACESLPKGMPLGQSLAEEGQFVGYFFKLLAVANHEGKYAATPMLIGKLAWRAPRPADAAASGGETFPWLWLAGGVLIVLFGLRWLLPLFSRKVPPVRQLLNRPRINAAGEEAVPVEDWLDQAQSGAQSSVSNENNGRSDHATESTENGNGASPH